MEGRRSSSKDGGGGGFRGSWMVLHGSPWVFRDSILGKIARKLRENCGEIAGKIAVPQPKPLCTGGTECFCISLHKKLRKKRDKKGGKLRKIAMITQQWSKGLRVVGGHPEIAIVQSNHA